MTIKQLEEAHLQVWVENGENPTSSSHSHTDVSLQFVIELLSKLNNRINSNTLSVYTKRILDATIENLKDNLKHK